MFWDILRIALEEVNRQALLARPGGQIDPRQQAVFNRSFSRVIISAITLWILVSGIIIRLEAYPYLHAVGIIANAGLIVFSMIVLYSLWKQPILANKILIRSGVFLTISAIIVCTSLLNIKVDDLRPEFFVVVISLIPSSIIYCVFVIVGRKSI